MIQDSTVLFEMSAQTELREFENAFIDYANAVLAHVTDRSEVIGRQFSWPMHDGTLAVCELTIGPMDEVHKILAREEGGAK